MLACFLGVISAAAAEGPSEAKPDRPARTAPPVIGTSQLRPGWDLDGTYLWLGPTGAAGRVDGAWDSLFGGHLAIVRVRERARLGALGGAFGASRWTERGGGRLWLDGLFGTRLGGRMIGASLGPTLEVSELTHPRPGAAVGLWIFLGVTPYVRIGVVDELGGFAEVGVHIALPVFRRPGSRRR